MKPQAALKRAAFLTFNAMSGRFRVRHGEWHVPRHHWWRDDPALMVLAFIVVACLLWLAWHKILQ
jgi:hypothetical protein